MCFLNVPTFLILSIWPMKNKAKQNPQLRNFIIQFQTNTFMKNGHFHISFFRLLWSNFACLLWPFSFIKYLGKWLCFRFLIFLISAATKGCSYPPLQPACHLPQARSVALLHSASSGMESAFSSQHRSCPREGTSFPQSLMSLLR